MPKPKVKIERGLPADIRTQTKVWNIAVNLVLIAGVVVRVEPAAAIDAPDGIYELRYVFDGKQRVQQVRVARGDLLGGF